MLKISFYNKIKHILIASLIAASTAHAAKNNFNCPQPNEIQSTDFTAPSIWTAPGVPHAVEGSYGIGLGGKVVKEFLGAEEAQVNHRKGWVCVYKSEGGVSVNEYEAKIRQIVGSTSYLKKYLAKVNNALDNAEPYLKNYPQDMPLGFVGYQAAE